MGRIVFGPPFAAIIYPKPIMGFVVTPDFSCPFVLGVAIKLPFLCKDNDKLHIFKPLVDYPSDVAHILILFD